MTPRDVLISGLLLAVATGYHHRGGAVTVEDTVAFELANMEPGVERGCMDAPDTGRLESIRWLTTQAGSDGGGSTMVLNITRAGSTICSLPVPCGSTLGNDVPTSAGPPLPCDVALAEGDHLEVVADSPSDCAVLPNGVLTVTFTWE